MKPICLVAACIILSLSANSQFTLYKAIDGVEFYTKWGNEKWWSKKSSKVLLVKVKNTNTLAVKYTLGVEFYKNLQLIEVGKEEEYCLSQYTTAFPRRRGLVFKPSEASSINEMDSFELSGLEIDKQIEYECPKN